MANKSPSVMGEHFPPHSTIVAPKTHTNPTLQKPKQDVSSEKFPQPYEIGSAKWFASIGALAVMELFLTILSFAPGGLLSQ